ncbi:ribose-phosphate pyrophosphokinase [Caldinitratiruptor microaerophilus]|uniref:Ribose-phosphate pyrophosphokinase n=1 Tax=Caldinitratiruptor microaerophilus TaxID=671077 RepID=A0AA35CME5_9FIRM|nr:ribose-phosphate pyrophosphokinase [Caldinitratiruptor microaerophilus]
MVGYQDRRLKIFAGNANPELAREIARHLGIELGDMEVGRFSNGEIRVKLNESVRGSDCFVIQPTCHPVNDNLMELLIILDALRRASARRITAVIPHYGYARQDRKARGREPISAKLVANLIVTAGARRVLTMDLHADQIQGFFDVPVDHLRAVPLIAEYFKRKRLENLTVVSPDTGGVVRARELAERLGVGLAIIDKRRPEPNQAEIMNVIGDIAGKTCILLDDMIDTAGTILEGAQALLERGAAAVYAAATHAVFSGPAYERLAHPGLTQVVVTNTIPVDAERLGDKLDVLSVAPLFGEAIIRIHEDLSVSKMFD